ncbi:MAG: GNAT family N-acetyltransferase [Pyrinomonadaceae bacterium]|nr:GNAT family N-acetyltransferase [Pyrinomonadaceae bacterium]
MLETERLFLRELKESDTDAIYAMRSDKDVMRFIREPQNRAETESWIQLVSSRWKIDKLGFCGVFEKKTGKFLGWCGVWRLAETKELEIGYAIAKQFWNRGYATEAAEIFLQYAFENIKPDKITAVAEPENTPSRRVMEKLGMNFVKIAEFYDRELVQYAITEKEFLAQRREERCVEGKSPDFS